MGRKGKKQKKDKENIDPWMCPVCDKRAAKGTFTCTFCDPPKWVHVKCGGYTYKQLENLDILELKCNNCKKVSYFLLALDTYC